MGILKRFQTTDSEGRVRLHWKPIAVVTLIVLMLIGLGSALSMPLWLRAVVPDRYIVAYAPQFVQNYVFKHHSDGDVLPTSAALDNAQASSLLQQVAQDAGDGVTSTANAAAQPSATVQVTVVPTPTETPEPPPPPSAMLHGFKHTYQGWNNCG